MISKLDEIRISSFTAEMAEIYKALRESGGNVSQAAKTLGISRYALRRRLQKDDELARKKFFDWEIPGENVATCGSLLGLKRPESEPDVQFILTQNSLPPRSESE